MKTNKKGMALIAALMTAFIFLALVSTLVLLSTAGSRQANYAKKATIALHLAEAGIADAIYRLNYCTATGGTFPFGPYPFASGQSSEIPFGTPNVESELVSATEIKGKVEEKGGSYEVKWDTSTTPYKLISTGTYKGTKRKLSVQIRGGTDSAYDRQYEKQGIPEAFNKHVIYAGTINSTGTPTITGNLCGVNISLAAGASGQYTVTKLPSALNICTLSFIPTTPVGPSAPTYTPTTTVIIRDDDGDSSGGPPDYTPDPGPPAADALPSASITYSGDGTNETYTLITNCSLPVDTKWRFERATAASTLTVIVQNNTSIAGTANPGFLEVINGDITLKFDGTNNPDLQGIVKADVGNIVINSGVAATPNDIGADGYSGTTLYAGGGITINYSATTGPIVVNGDIGAVGAVTSHGSTIYGSLLANSNINLLTAASAIYGDVSTDGGSIDLQSTSGGSTIKGSLLAANTITLASAATAIYGDPAYGVSAKDAPIIIYSATTAQININASPKIYLNEDNKAAIIAYATGGTATIDVDANLTDSEISSATSQSQPTIVAYTTSANDAAVNIGSAAAADVNGLIYAHSSNAANAGNITIGTNAGAINGLLVASGIVDLNDKTIAWDKTPFTDATNTDTQIYQGFSGGRRVYLPVLGSWRQE